LIDAFVFIFGWFSILNTPVNKTHAVVQKALNDVVEDGICKNPAD
jgi:hypothetical protein